MIYAYTLTGKMQMIDQFLYKPNSNTENGMLSTKQPYK